MTQSVSPPDPDTTNSSQRSLTDLWRDLGTLGAAWRADHSQADHGRAYIDTRTEFDARLDTIAGQWEQASGDKHESVTDHGTTTLTPRGDRVRLTLGHPDGNQWVDWRLDEAEVVRDGLTAWIDSARDGEGRAR